MWVALSLTVLGVTVLSLYVRLKLAKDRALGLSGMLITAQEKERSRLASEIHDDFSQRMALLALGLETAEDAIGSSPAEAIRQVHDLLNSASNNKHVLWVSSVPRTSGAPWAAEGAQVGAGEGSDP